MLTHHPPQDVPDSAGQENSLFIAAQHNREEMVEFLLTESKSNNSPNSEGVTPLMAALKEGNTEIVRILLQEQDVIRSLLEERDNDEKNVFHYAFGSRKPAEVTQILVGAVSSIYQNGYSEQMKEI